MKKIVITTSIIVALIVGLYIFSRPDRNFNDGMVAFKLGNYRQAVELLAKSSNRNKSSATAMIGNIYAFGLGVDKDSALAVSYFRKVKNNEHAIWTIRYIVKSYKIGNGVEKDENEAAYWESILSQFEKEYEEEKGHPLKHY